jgi:hypothetical protein
MLDSYSSFPGRWMTSCSLSHQNACSWVPHRGSRVEVTGYDGWGCRSRGWEQQQPREEGPFLKQGTLRCRLLGPKRVGACPCRWHRVIKRRWCTLARQLLAIGKAQSALGTCASKQANSQRGQRVPARARPSTVLPQARLAAWSRPCLRIAPCGANACSQSLFASSCATVGPIGGGPPPLYRHCLRVEGLLGRDTHAPSGSSYWLHR